MCELMAALGNDWTAAAVEMEREMMLFQAELTHFCSDRERERDLFRTSGEGNTSAIVAKMQRFSAHSSAQVHACDALRDLASR